MAKLDVQSWTASAVPDLSGRTAVVTGASAGLGLETARVLASRGARTVLACRNPEKAARAAEQIRWAHPSAELETVDLDLSSLASVREAAGELRSRCQRLDLLVNNAGVMNVPYERTEDGFELTLATNHLGHFALTGLVMERLLATRGSRVVTVSSEAHRRGVVRFDDLQSEGGYRPSAAYGQSKLANLLFTYELDRRLRAAGAGTSALAAHPGVVATDLFRTSSWLERAVLSPRLRALNSRLVQSTEMGALPSLRAAVDPEARGGEFYGPARRYVGPPVRAQSSARSHDAAAQARLFELSEQLTQVTYHLDVGSGAPPEEL